MYADVPFESICGAAFLDELFRKNVFLESLASGKLG